MKQKTEMKKTRGDGPGGKRGSLEGIGGLEDVTAETDKDITGALDRAMERASRVKQAVKQQVEPKPPRRNCCCC